MRALVRDLWLDPVPVRDRVSSNLPLLIGRLIVALPLFPNGFRKLGSFEQVAAAMGGVPQVIDGRPFPVQTPLITFPMPELFLGLSVAFDLLGATLLVLGWRTRTVGLLLAGYVLVAMTIFHSDIRGPADVQAIIRNLPLLAGLIMIAGVGAGAWSLDGWRNRKSG